MKFVSIAILLLAIQASPIVEGLDSGNIFVSYFSIGSGNSVVPNMSSLSVHESEYVQNINYASTSGSFVGSGFADNVGAIFDGCIAVPSTGEWRFYTRSDDGSMMYINDEEVVDNDGLHGMETKSGSILLNAGKARARVTFFENGGGAGLIVSWQGPGVEEQVIPASAWVPCGTIGANGDPHIKTWTGEQFDFHGICDLVLVSNAEFDKGAGLDVHIRSKKIREWSYVDSAAVRIGTDILEVRGGESRNFWINGIEGNGNTDKLSISEYPIQYYPTSEKSEKFIVNLGNGEGIVFKTWNSFVSVEIKNPKKDKFMGSVGLMGSFPEGTKIGRENSIIDDINFFGQEWQVLSGEQNLFHDIEGPQHPQPCEIPSSMEMRRRLAESFVTVEDAENACVEAGMDDKELCIFDVMATNDKSSAGAY